MNRQSDNISFIIKTTRKCNLNCKYCFERDNNSKEIERSLLISLFKVLNSMYWIKKINFIWHGGEPLLLGQEFYERIIKDQKKYIKKEIYNSIQTNGTLLSKQFVTFLNENYFNIGISFDGLMQIHDINRIFPDGNKSSEIIIKNLKIVNDNTKKFGILSVLSNELLDTKPVELLDFLKENRIYKIALLPLRLCFNNREEYLIYIAKVKKYLNKFIDLIISDKYKEIELREFESKIDILFENKPRLCHEGQNCVGKYFTINNDGLISHCDKFDNFNFLKMEYNLDNFKENIESRGIEHYKNIEIEIRNKCKICKYFSLCNGGCLYDLVQMDRFGVELGTNQCLHFFYYEKAYAKICDHIRKI